MKTHNLIVLVVLAGAMIGWAAWTMRPQPKPGTALIGTPVLPNLPVNQVHQIVITTANNTVTLAKVKGTWSVASRFGYPANFDKIANNLLQLSEMKVGQVVTTGESQKGRFNLLDPAATTPANKAQAGTRVELRDENNGVIASLLVGKTFIRRAPESGAQAPLAFGDYPDGQYVQTADGRVLLVGQTLEGLTDDARNWLASEFISAAADDIRNIAITAPDRAPIKLARAKKGEPFALEGLQETEGTLDSAKVNQISGALNNLGFDDIAAPTLAPKETGLEHPVIFEAQTQQGQIYTLRIGNTLTNDTFDRYVQVAVAWKAPTEAQDEDKATAAQPPLPAGNTQAKDAAAPNTLAAANAQRADELAKTADQSKALNDQLAPWTFILKSYRVEPLLTKRQELIKKAEAPKPDAVKEKQTPGGQRLTPGAE